MNGPGERTNRQERQDVREIKGEKIEFACPIESLVAAPTPFLSVL